MFQDTNYIYRFKSQILIRNRYARWRKERISNKREYILVGLPLTHSLFVFTDFEAFIWYLCNGKNSIEAIITKVLKKYGKDYKEKTLLFIEELLRSNLLIKK
jgi:hypothetical protein